MGRRYSMYLLEAGQIILSESPICVRTILGSCVSVTFFHPGSGTAAIIHGLYPGKGSNASYTETAIEMVVSELQKRGIHSSMLEIKLFGGARITLSQKESKYLNSVSDSNVDSAKKALSRFDLIVSQEDTGCEYGRELRFFTDSGDVYIKKIRPELIPCDSCDCEEKECIQCPRG